MNIESERGQALIIIILIGIAVLLLVAGMTANLPGMKKVADTFGETIGDTIDNITAEDLAISWWVNQQRLVPNKYAVESHGAVAWATVDCCNRNGAFQL